MKEILLGTMLALAVLAIYTSSAPAATLSESPANIAQGGSVTVIWTAIAAPTNRDWIGLYASGAADTAYLDWFYDNTCTRAGVNTTPDHGTCPFNISNALPNGTYELRLYANNNYIRLATSGPFTVGAQRACVQPPQGLVSWWDAEGDANDIVGTNHGILQNGTTFGPGKVGQAFRFDGVNDFVKVPYATNLSPGDQLTLEFWMKGDVNNPMNGCCQGLVGTDFYKIEGFDYERGIGFNVSLNEGTSYVGAGTLWGNGYPSGFGLIPGQWHHIAGTSDGSLLRLYVDGHLKSAMVQLGNISPMRTASFLAFGSEDGDSNNPSATANRYFFGLIDEVSIYNRALSPDEVAAIYAAGDNGKCK